MANDLEENIDKMFGISKASLHPPQAPPRASERSSMSEVHAENPRTPADVNLGNIDSELALDISIDLDSMPAEYWQYCDSNDAKRAWNRAVFFKTNRTSTAQLKRDVQKKKQDLEMIEYMKRNKYSEYRECMNELKEKLRGKRIE